MEPHLHTITIWPYAPVGNIGNNFIKRENDRLPFPFGIDWGFPEIWLRVPVRVGGRNLAKHDLDSVAIERFQCIYFKLEEVLHGIQYSIVRYMFTIVTNRICRTTEHFRPNPITNGLFHSY